MPSIPTLALYCLLVLILGSMVVTCARAQDCREGDFGCGHAEHHEQYKNWHSPYDGGSCCNENDCRPTRARQREDGSWEAWVEGAWRKVPMRALLKPDLLKDGRSHVCSPKYSADVIYCFSPSAPRG